MYNEFESLNMDDLKHLPEIPETDKQLNDLPEEPDETMFPPSGKEEVFKVYLTEREFPIAYKKRRQELIDQGLTKKQAEEAISDEDPIKFELVYSVGKGFFAVEAEAVSSNVDIRNPYTGKLMIIENKK